MFKIVNDEHSGKVKSFMLDVLCPLITESDIVGNELLDIILMNIVEPNKTQKKNAYFLAKELVIKCSDTLEPYIQAVSRIDHNQRFSISIINPSLYIMKNYPSYSSSIMY